MFVLNDTDERLNNFAFKKKPFMCLRALLIKYTELMFYVYTNQKKDTKSEVTVSLSKTCNKTWLKRSCY